MDISTFRWTLIIIGIAIVAAIFLFGSPERKRKPRASRKPQNVARQRQEPTLDGTSEQADTDPEDRPVLQAEFDMDNGLVAPVVEEKKPVEPAGPPPDMIITLYLQARDNHVICGVDLLDAAIKSGLVFGDQDIFHRIQEGDDRPVFSMANLTKPGWFDKTSWNTLETIGVTMFMTLPGPVSGLDAWDSMLATAKRVAELVNAEILDDTRAAFTRERGAQIRDGVRAYDREHADIT
jgi:cell division protein ZipA